METRLRTERGQGREEKEEEKCQTANPERSLIVKERKREEGIKKRKKPYWKPD